LEPTRVSARLTDLLHLERPPVALVFTDEPPQAVAQPAGPVPSACSFWREAERGVFYAPAENHFNCPVGAMVMGFELPAEISEQLGGLVESMCQQGYLALEEPAKIPTMDSRHRGIVYGPLAEIPAPPDVILMWLSPLQAMIYSEATGSANWTGALMEVSGRPACAALPKAVGRHEPGLSLGCAGMRTFTAISEDRMLAVLPGSEAEEFVAALERIVSANATMGAYYQDKVTQLSSPPG
jgi:uncharacterized protein (DUF169 family)